MCGTLQGTGLASILGGPFFEPEQVETKQDPNCIPVKIIKNSHPMQLREAKVDFDNETDHSGPLIKK